MAIAIAVGTAPKKSPETASSTERTSKVRPGITVRGAIITPMPTAPSVTPVNQRRRASARRR